MKILELDNIEQTHIIGERKSTFKVGSIWDRVDREYTAGYVLNGGIVGVFNRGVNALWIDAKNHAAVSKLQEIKGEGRQGRPVALTIGFDVFARMIDTNSLTAELQEFLALSRDLKNELGSLCFIRAPLKPEFIDRVPYSSISVDEKGRTWIQTWDPYGHKPTDDLIRIMVGLGIEFPAVTSMNISGQPEIVDQIGGERFCREYGIPVYLKDEKTRLDLQGSYTIITLSEKGAELTRDGNVPGRAIQSILRVPLITEGARQSNYPQLDFPPHLVDGLSPRGVRMAILLYLEGREIEQINRTLKKNKVYKSNV